MSASEVDLLGVPLDHGAGRRGVGMGPSALRIAGVSRALERIGWNVKDQGDLEILIPETQAISDPNARFLPIVAQACAELADSVEQSLARGAMPLILGGDHSLSVGSISGVAGFLASREDGGRGTAGLGVLWFDAHADINSPKSTPSGNIHGMPVACLLGDGPPELTDIKFPGAKILPERTVQIGLRDIDSGEGKRLRESGVHTFTMEDIDRRRLADVVAEAIDIIRPDCTHLHVSFDIDILDPTVAPGTGTPKNGGLTYREAHLAMELVAETGLLRSFELVEVNPVLDHANKTARLGVGLIASALGKRIL